VPALHVWVDLVPSAQAQGLRTPSSQAVKVVLGAGALTHALTVTKNVTMLIN
jgi:hypothetical protein